MSSRDLGQIAQYIAAVQNSEYLTTKPKLLTFKLRPLRQVIIYIKVLIRGALNQGYRADV